MPGLRKLSIFVEQLAQDRRRPDIAPTPETTSNNLFRSWPCKWISEKVSHISVLGQSLNKRTPGQQE
ncbi:hypothetical protein WH95_09000 [Kiloniella litopenaei]|uniref:Uncharacterized protein n=1 Tax=Kiloniella litopenaei TaxID=1549748 RepID=A0A0M2RB31_9PROT|nr:hypothetical protein WH95_09000 [Kiloniella litopenaei]